MTIHMLQTSSVSAFSYFVLLLGGVLLQSCGSERQNGQGNELRHSSSPYLLQHAMNPVDWYPYGEEALALAQKQNKLVIVSVGYASCHWCHVMEEETFEDSLAAAVMNASFVSIKVDREERPDIDDLYMSACQLVSREPCGWPLNVFCLPDGRPFFALTYAPKEDWIGAAEHFARMYREEPETLEDYAQRLTEGVIESGLLPPVDSSMDSFQPDVVDSVASRFLSTIDMERGGHFGAPRFPLPGHFEFLLEYAHESGDSLALRAVQATLRGMALGGIYDHLGGGFARYSTDDRWLVPHFEKMLYDNAQLISLYSRAYRATPDPLYRDVVSQSIAFAERELRDPTTGAFYSSLDADSEGEEGTFYIWTNEDLTAALPSEPLRIIAAEIFDVSEGGNWEKGKNVLNRSKGIPPDGFGASLTEESLRDSIDKIRSLLLAHRSFRERPSLDNKILTSWNALMITAYTEAYQSFGKEEWLKSALTIGGFLQSVMMQKDGRLRRSAMNGTPSINAFLDDYALTAAAFIDLYQVTFDESWLLSALLLIEYAESHFHDSSSGMYFYTSDVDPPLVTRSHELEDDVIPASNSVMAHNLFDLGHFFYREDLLDRSRTMLSALFPVLSEEPHPHYFSNWSRLLLRHRRPAWEIAIVGPESSRLRSEMQRKFLPHALWLGGPTEGTLELLKDKLQPDQTYIYVCRNKVCRLPVTAPDKALNLLSKE